VIPLAYPPIFPEGEIGIFCADCEPVDQVVINDWEMLFNRALHLVGGCSAAPVMAFTRRAYVCVLLAALASPSGIFNIYAIVHITFLPGYACRFFPAILLSCFQLSLIVVDPLPIIVDRVERSLCRLLSGSLSAQALLYMASVSFEVHFKPLPDLPIVEIVGAFRVLLDPAFVCYKGRFPAFPVSCWPFPEIGISARASA